MMQSPEAPEVDRSLAASAKAAQEREALQKLGEAIQEIGASTDNLNHQAVRYGATEAAFRRPLFIDWSPVRRRGSVPSKHSLDHNGSMSRRDESPRRNSGPDRSPGCQRFHYSQSPEARPVCRMTTDRGFESPARKTLPVQVATHRSPERTFRAFCPGEDHTPVQTPVPPLPEPSICRSPEAERRMRGSPSCSAIFGQSPSQHGLARTSRSPDASMQGSIHLQWSPEPAHRPEERLPMPAQMLLRSPGATRPAMPGEVQRGYMPGSPHIRIEHDICPPELPAQTAHTPPQHGQVHGRVAYRPYRQQTQAMSTFALGMRNTPPGAHPAVEAQIAWAAMRHPEPQVGMRRVASEQVRNEPISLSGTASSVTTDMNAHGADCGSVGADLAAAAMAAGLLLPEAAASREPPQGAARARFPCTGKPISVKLMFGHIPSTEPPIVSEFEGYQVTSDWELEHLLQLCEVVTGTHRDTLSLYHAGREMSPNCSILRAIGVQEGQMPDRFTVHIVVNDDCFPHVLGPFSLINVPLSAEDIRLPNYTQGGFHWMMKKEAVERHGIRSTDGAHVTAQCSPLHPVILSAEERAAAGVPDQAVDFAWSYPVASWEQVEHDPHLLVDWAAIQQDNCLVKDFLVVGGFIYLDAAQRIVQVSTPRVSKSRVGGMHFTRPQKWEAEWTRAMLGDGRFHRVTIGPLMEAGVRYFCWLRPGERIDGPDGQPLARQPQVPKGGFAYLFHELNATSVQDLAPDSYFAFATMAADPSSKSEPFVLVGEERHSELTGHTSAQLNLHNMSYQDTPRFRVL